MNYVEILYCDLQKWAPLNSFWSRKYFAAARKNEKSNQSRLIRAKSRQFSFSDYFFNYFSFLLGIKNFFAQGKKLVCVHNTLHNLQWSHFVLKIKENRETIDNFGVSFLAIYWISIPSILNSRKNGMLLESNQAEKLLTHSNWIQNLQRLQERSHHV